MFCPEVGLMDKVWRIVAVTRPSGEEPSRKEYFLVALSDQVSALENIRIRRPDLKNAQIAIVGEADPESIEWLELRRGQVIHMMAAP